MLGMFPNVDFELNFLFTQKKKKKKKEERTTKFKHRIQRAIFFYMVRKRKKKNRKFENIYDIKSHRIFINYP